MFEEIESWLKLIEYPLPVGEEMIEEIPHGTRFVVLIWRMVESFNP